MQLTYRGNHYKLPTSAIKTVAGDVVGKYRGAILRTHRCVVVPATQPLNCFIAAHTIGLLQTTQRC